MAAKGPLRGIKQYALHQLVANYWSLPMISVFGAPLIGATAAYGVAIEMQRDASDASLDNAWERLHETRPTAVNLRWALDDMALRLGPLAPDARAAAAWS